MKLKKKDNNNKKKKIKATKQSSKQTMGQMFKPELCDKMLFIS